MLDALIIGGGFYGMSIANYLVRQRGFNQVRLVEREPCLMSRASYHNQARIHNGYHYPRSYVTAYRSRINFARFVANFRPAVCRNFVKLYAIARRNSKVNAKQFVRFCKEIGAYLEPAPLVYRQLFDDNLIEAVFLVEEYALDAASLGQGMARQLTECGVHVSLEQRVMACRKATKGLAVDMASDDGERLETVRARYVFNCTYSGLNRLGGEYQPASMGLKHEITEMGLVAMPESLQGVGITVMDGPFFSTMPFPSRGLHSLSHVRYTPHSHWYDDSGADPYQRLADYAKEPRVDRMLRDARRYLPALAEARCQDSLFEVKTILVKNETDDGRPILFEKSQTLPGFFAVLGGKIDNIYDIIDYLDREPLQKARL